MHGYCEYCNLNFELDLSFQPTCPRCGSDAEQVFEDSVEYYEDRYEELDFNE